MRTTTLPEPQESDDDFIARALRSRDEARRTGEYHSVESVTAELRQKVAQARAKQAQREEDHH